jgi:predicted P-loop ATPase
MGKADMSRVKSFMSRNIDRFRPPYGRRLIESPRQCVFVGTVNHSEYLRDETGGRRFWPVACGRIDLDGLKHDRDQLWAEAVARYRQGEHWWLDTPELNQDAEKEQDSRYQADPWEERVAGYLNLHGEVTTADILEHVLEKAIGHWTHSDEMRVGSIVRRLGWKPYRPRDGKTRLRVYRKG